MEAKNAPFSLYDFLGYFFPGAFSILVFVYSAKALGMSVSLPSINSLAEITNLLPFVLSSYLLGHAVALLSSFTIERFYIWSFNYPSKTLLRYEGPDFFTSRSSSNIYRVAVSILLAPISCVVILACLFTQRKLGMIHQLDTLLTRMIRRKITALIVDAGQISRPNDYVGPRECDYFRLVYHYTVESCPSHLPKMQNYVALFGFHRACSFIFICVFWMALATLIFGQAEEAIPVLAASGVISNIFFFGFAKFYRRFSLESLMALGANYRIPATLAGVKLPGAPKKKENVGRDMADSKPAGTMVLSRFRSRLRLFSDSEGAIASGHS